MNSPCKDCANRFLGCHSVCAGYQEFQAEREMICNAKRKFALVNEYFTETKAAYAIHRDKNKHYSMSVN